MSAPLPTAPPLLRLENLTRRFGERVAVQGLSLEVFAGEVLGFLGPNGAGKSTTFSLLAGLLVPDEGRVWLEGRPLALHDASLRAQMGVVFQKNSLDEQLTARENLLLGAHLYAVPRTHAQRRASELLDWMGLAARADERVSGFSGGMRRRLELARALIHRPRILLMDEPTQGLDEASFRTFWAHLNGLRQERPLTVLLTTHRPDEAAMCERLAVIDEGRLLSCQTPAALVAMLRGEMLCIDSAEPDLLEKKAREEFGLFATRRENWVLLPCEGGHLLIPRLVEALPKGSIRSVELRRPTLADVFEKLTGRSLDEESPGKIAGKRSHAA